MAKNTTSIKAVATRLRGIINKHAGVEELPIRFGDGVELTPREIHVIQAIGDHKLINVRDLAGHFCVTKSAASQMVSKLVKRKLVRKRQAPHSNKELQLDLTDQGLKAHRVHEKMHADHKSELEKELAGFSEADLQTTASVLKIIESVLERRLSRMLDE